MRKVTKMQFDWKGSIETLEDRRVMSADSLLSIEHHALEEDAVQIEHQLISEPDFWIDPSDLTTISEQIDQVEQTLSSAHNTTGLNTVVTNYGFTGKGQTVAVLDSGIAYDHFALGGGFGANYRVVGGWDFSGENDANPYDDGPAGSHGTHVAGIIGGSSGVDKGVAPGVDLVALRVFDDAGNGYFSWVENALRWVHNNRNSFENPITAINLSLGVASWNSVTVPSWSTLEDEFAQLEADGIFIAVSAGNSYTTYNSPGLGYPAASPYVVPVMSVTDSGALAGYSQRDVRAIAAPGSAIRSTVPDYKGNNNGITDDYANFSGTSMASPYIAGASVLIRQAMEFVGRTNITQDNIYDHMMATATSFVDSSTNLTFKRLNLGAAINALMPTDDYGSTAATAHNFGSLNAAKSATGVISTLSDVDYFKFTAASNGRVSFDVSNATYDMDAAWTLTNGSGELSNNGDTFSFDVVAGQTYTVGLSSSGGLGYYDLDVTSQSTFTYTDWGSVSYSTLNNLSVSGEAWYRVQASQNGYITVESLFGTQSGQINLQLYNADRTQLLNSGNANNGASRVEAYAVAGQQYYVCVLGTNADVDYRLSNMVSVSGTTVTVGGTAGNDTFSFAAGNNHTIVVNGVSHSFASIAVSGVQFNGGGGSDTITLTGTSAAETATLRTGSATFAGAGFVVDTASTENVTVYGSGNDQANFYDSAGDDVYIAWYNQVSMSGSGYRNEVRGFGSTTAQASFGGNDQALFYDTAGNDAYVAWFNQASMSGNGYRNEVQGFDSTTAQAYSGGNDQASFFDTAGDDVYLAWFNQASMSGNGYRNEVRGFDSTTAQAYSGGNDQASFFDTAGDDVYLAWFNQASMSGSGYRNEVQGFDSTTAQAYSGGNDQASFFDTAGDDAYLAWYNQASMSGSGYRNEVQGFDSTIAQAYSGGNDQASFFDTAGDDVYLAWFNQASMSGTGYRNEVRGFDSTAAQAYSGGNDQASFFDTAGDDIYMAWFNHASMSGSGYRNEVQGFDSTTAQAYSGGNDQASFFDTAGDDLYVAWFNQASMSGVGYRNEARGFESTLAQAVSGGNDKASFYDTAGDEFLLARVWGAYLSGVGYYNEAHNFEHVSAQLINGGSNIVDAEPVDYLFDLIGQWS